MKFTDSMHVCYVPQGVYILKVPTFINSKKKFRWLHKRTNIMPRNWIDQQYIIIGVNSAPPRFMQEIS